MIDVRGQTRLVKSDDERRQVLGGLFFGKHMTTLELAGAAQVGIDIGGTKMLVVAGGETLRVDTGPDATPAQLERAIRDQLVRLGITPTVMGIAIPGLVEADGRVRMSGVLPKLAGWHPAVAFADYGCTVHALNDAEAALVEEAQDLPADATAGIVMAGTAIGAAFRVDGKPLRGARGWAGELGYLPVVTPHGVKRLDEVTGGRFIAATLGIDGAELASRAQQGDATALAAIREGGIALGLALAGLINLLNPHLLVLGGGTMQLPGYADAMREAIREYSLPPMLEACELRDARSGPTVVAMGALRAALAL
jgi:predicted NBD/HSP70 family sugar kinase